MPVVKVRDIEYGYIEAGDGPLVIAAHGTFGGKELFQPQLQRLSTRFHSVSIDWPGHGESSYDPSGWTVDDLVDDVPELISAFGAQTAALVGVSQGGAVFMRAALRYPEVVDALVLMCSGDGPPPDAARSAMSHFANRLHAAADINQRRRLAEDFAETVFHAPGFATRHPEAAAAEVDIMVNHPRAALPLVIGVPASYRSIRGDLADIDCPTLVIWGRHDPRPLLGETIAEAIPHAEYHAIEQAGHHVHVDAPEETAGLIDEFLTRRITKSKEE